MDSEALRQLSIIASLRETFSRILAKFRDAGLLDVDGLSLHVPDVAALRQVFEENIGAGGSAC